MKNMFSNFLKLSILSSIIFILFGLLLFINPDGVITSISLIIGLILLIIGIVELVCYFKDRINYQNILMLSLFFIATGIILISNPNIIATIIPIFIGVCMLALGIQKIDIAMLIKGTGRWVYILIAGIVTLLCGILLIVNPIKGAFIATKMIGLIIMIYSVLDIIDCLVLKKNVKEINKIIEVE